MNGAPDKEAARIISKSIICSSLLKSALFGNDANWGRVICAAGYADTDFDASDIDVSLSSWLRSDKPGRHSGTCY